VNHDGNESWNVFHCKVLKVVSQDLLIRVVRFTRITKVDIGVVRRVYWCS